MENKFNVLLIMIIGLFFISNVVALGVSPARNTLDFSSGSNNKYVFKIINSEAKDMNLEISARGDLVDYINLNKRMVNIISGDEMIEIGYHLNLPDSLSPGLHVGEIVISEPSQDLDDGVNFVGATLAVVTQIHVYVPYPGKYADAKLNIINAEVGGEAIFVIPVVSRGKFDLVDVYANVDVYSDLNEKIDSFNTESYSVASGEKIDIMYKWNAKVPIGNYKAKVALVYDGEVINLEDEFKVGQASIELQDLYVNDFSLGDIVKVDMLLENKWSEPIIGVRSVMEIFGNDGNLLDKILSPNYDIEALNKQVISSYWDTAGVGEGNYDTTITLSYGENSVDNELELVVSDNSLQVVGLGYVISSDKRGTSASGGDNNMVMILLIVVGLLVMVNLLWFMIFRKMMAKK